MTIIMIKKFARRTFSTQSGSAGSFTIALAKHTHSTPFISPRSCLTAHLLPALVAVS